jgi:ABC-2 type transport system permease protein
MTSVDVNPTAHAAAALLAPGSYGSFWTETRALTRRWYLQTKREKMMLVFGLVQPLLWLLLFGNVFAGVAKWRPEMFGTSNYLAFQTAGILALTVLGNAMMGGIPLLFDRESGMLAKILATPCSRGSLLASRFIFTSAFSLVQTLIILAVAFAMGVRIETGLLGFLAILWSCFLLSVGFTILSLMLAFVFPSHGAFFAITGFLTQPLLFLSTALMPVTVMPGWIQVAVWLNPLTYAVEVVRSAILGPVLSLQTLIVSCWEGSNPHLQMATSVWQER